MGFSHNHLTGTGIGDLGNVLLMPTVGALKLIAGSQPGEGYRSGFSHDQETARPGYYRVYLPDYKVNVELTATARVGVHRYTCPEAADSHIVVDLWHGIGGRNRLRPTDSAPTIESDHTLSGFRRSAGWGGDKIYYFVMEVSRPFDAGGLVSNGQAVEGKQATGKNLQAHFDYYSEFSLWDTFRAEHPLLTLVNEPCHHYAYLYAYAGQPWKTQARVRQICRTLYNNTTAGMCGNDDCGQMSVWYVFTALGLYPADPCGGVYLIGSPLVDRATLHLDPTFYPGGKFTLVAKDNSATNQFIQSATLNGRPLTRNWLTHGEIVASGSLVLQMGPEPDKSWGAAPAARPGGI